MQLATVAAGEQTTMPPSIPPVTQAYPLGATPVLDGDVLGDAAWQGAKATTGFWQIRPDEGRPASQRTEVFVGFTSKSLYIGVVCYDDDPEAIIVADSRRDSSLVDTDSFQVMIDSFRDRQNGFVFGTNPAGIEYDGQVTKESAGSFSAGGGGFNLNWDTTW
ncbi:MAG: carbohydrate binding family 9 domain-containing protein, partial [Gammaproteobacteria bacterium]|nr:carbohydrate binding family 9 domain-containing protein [Gammaproteobacteria bacterium]